MKIRGCGNSGDLGKPDAGSHWSVRIPAGANRFHTPSNKFAFSILMSKTGFLMYGAALAASAFSLAAQHAHVNAGVTGTGEAERLAFLNASRFAAESGYVATLPRMTNGTYAGYYAGSALTFTALPATPIFGGPEEGHAALGAHLVLRVVSVDGPAGGSFAFWETPGDELDAEQIAFSVPVGERNGIREFPLSENGGAAGEDPYGHYHGRKFSVTLPGLYQVGYVVRDTSRNGPGGGPFHADSEVTVFNYQAGVTIASVGQTEAGPQLTFATVTGSTYRIETSQSLGADAVWTTVGDLVTGNNRMASVTVSQPQSATFFRLRVE
jgi:hypothetical protein